MPVVSQQQRKLIFAKRGQYGSEKKTPDKWKWIWESGWENKGKLPKFKRKRKINEVLTFEQHNEFIKENVEYITKKIVNDCWDCPFLGKSPDGMECDHPYFKDKGAYDNMIITHNNSHQKVPNECPLKQSSVTMIKKIELKKIKRIQSKEDPYGEENWDN